MEQAEYEELMKFVPGNTEAEAALLGALMIDNRFVSRVQTKLRFEHFLEPTHARVYERILFLTSKEKPANPVTLRPYFMGETIPVEGKDADAQQEIGIPAYLVSLTGNAVALIGVDGFADQIIELAAMREMMGVASMIAGKVAARDREIDPRGVIADVEVRLAEIGGGLDDQKKTGSSWERAFEETVAEAAAIADGTQTNGFKIVGYDDWNDVNGPMSPADFIQLGGRPSMGKTGVACAVAAGSALAGHGTDFLSLEMEKRLISRRILANMIYDGDTTSRYAELADGRYTDDDRAAIARARAVILGKPLFIDAPEEFYVEDLLPWLLRRRRIWATKGVEHRLCIIDYLERFATRQPFTGSGAETARVSYISRVVKSAAKKAGIAIIILVQLSRGVESREDKRPVISDLRQSGTLEQDADSVVFVYRDEYYLERSKPRESDQKKYEAWYDDWVAARDRLELYSVKRREGAPTKRTGYFFADFQAVRSSTFFKSEFGLAGMASFDFTDQQEGGEG